jgi:hypothetical protein
VVQKAWNLALQRFTKTLGSKPPAAVGATWRGLTDQWLAVANDTLMEAHRSDEFIEAQRRMLRTAVRPTPSERRIAEAWVRGDGTVPTRSESRRASAPRGRAAARGDAAASLRTPDAVMERGLATKGTTRLPGAATGSAAGKRAAPEDLEMPTTRKSPAAQAIAELDDLNFKLARGQRMLQRLKDEDVQIATADKEGGVPRGQDDALPLQEHREAHDRRAGAGAYGQIGATR